MYHNFCSTRSPEFNYRIYSIMDSYHCKGRETQLSTAPLKTHDGEVCIQHKDCKGSKLSIKGQAKLSTVLDLSGVEITFFIAVLCCCALYLVLYQSWLHPSVLAATKGWQYQGFLFNLLPQQTSRVGVGKRLEGGIPWTADPN